MGPLCERGKLVIYHGQISGANYVNLYIRAAKTVLSRRSDIAFVVVGGGDHLDEAKDLANQLRLGKRLTFTGEVPHNEIPYYIAAADVAVACFEDNPQSRCKSPLKLAEYMASGKAIVASRIPEVLNMIGNSGLLVDPENPDDIAPAIEKIIDNEALREQLGRRVRKRSEQFYNWKRGAQTLIEAYKKALDYRYQITKPERRPAIPKRDVKEI
jgi:glycosyltransferase involved in cell wall biosynthesis